MEHFLTPICGKHVPLYFISFSSHDVLQGRYCYAHFSDAKTKGE